MPSSTPTVCFFLQYPILLHPSKILWLKTKTPAKSVSFFTGKDPLLNFRSIHDTNNNSASFLDMMYENFLLPYISSPTRVTPRSQSLTDNIFSNIIEDEIISGNITTTISDHYAQFKLFKNKTKSQKNTKIAKFARNYKTLDKEMFDSDIKNTNWKEIL